MSRTFAYNPPMPGPPEERFWNAVRENDASSVSTLLEQHPTFANLRFRGVAWDPCPAVAPPDDFVFTNTALHVAAVKGYAEIASALIKAGTDIDAIGYEENKGLTPAVVLAAWEGSLETLRVLLECGADPNLAASAETALYTAVEHKAADKVQLLLEHGARHDIFTAAMVGDVETVAMMVAAYPTLRNARSLKRNRTPVEEASHHGQDAVVGFFGQ